VSVYSVAGMRADAAVVFGPGGYCLGVIDVLQRYTLSKRLERFVKCFVLRQNPRGVSVLPPDDYSVRFREQISRVIGSLRPQKAGCAQQIIVEIRRMG
jgi:1-phosphatidylinositol-4-phosphate 5-kinase